MTLWEPALKRFVYDGSQLVQEHDWTASGNGTWAYTYTDINRDYLGHPGGIRQREGTKASHDDYYMQLNNGVIEYKTERPLTPSIVEKEERTISLNQLPNSTFTNISNLATANGYVEMYGGTTAGASAGFDGLVQMGGRHFLSGVEMFTNREGNGPYTAPAQTMQFGIEGGGLQPGEVIPGSTWQCDLCWRPGEMPQCWKVVGVDPPYPGEAKPNRPSALACAMLLVDCNGERCKDGIQCPEDINSGYSLDPNWSGAKSTYQEWGKCYIEGKRGERCDNLGSSLAGEIRSKIAGRVGGEGGCIRDPVLAKCILDKMYTVPLYCNCEPLNSGDYMCTDCSGICVNSESVKKFSITHLASFVLHELVHYCMGCVFKRPTTNDAHAIAAATCQRWCFEGYGIPRQKGLPGEYGTRHGWRYQWDNYANCSVCGVPEQQGLDKPSTGPVSPAPNPLFPH